MNPLVRKVMVETMRQAQELSKIVDDVPHLGLRGQFRESFLSSALRHWLPRGLELGTGVLVDEFGSSRESNEDDIIIYSPYLLSAALPLIDRNIYLLDSVLVHIEVKSKLTSANLLSALKNAIEIHKLKKSYEGRREVRAIFAYKSDVSNTSELTRLKGHLKSLGWTKDESPIQFICVDQKECFMHGHAHIGDKPETVGTWIDLIPGVPADSTLAFISSLVSSLNDVRNERKFVQLARFVYDTNGTKIVD